MRAALLVFCVLLLGCDKSSVESAGGLVPTAKATETDTFMKSFTVRRVSATDAKGVAGVQCLRDEDVVGGGCNCSGSPVSGTAGILFSCAPSGNGFLAACYIHPVFGGLVAPVEVKALCATTESGDAVINKLSSGQPYDGEFESAKLELERMVAEHNSAMRNGAR